MEAARHWDEQSELGLAGASEPLVDAPEDARALADKHHLPLVDLGETGVDGEAVKAIALPVLNRAAAIPFDTDGGRLKVAITDPGDVRALDELRLATRQTVEFHVAAEEDILTELRRLTRAAGAMNAGFDEMVTLESEEAEQDDLEAEDGISDAPLVRLVNSMIFEAAEDGASDIHVEPHGERAGRPQPDRRRPPRRPSRPEAARVRRHHPPQGAGEARHRRAAEAAGRADLAERRGRRAHARHPRGDAADGRRRVRDDAAARQVARGADARLARPLAADERRDRAASSPARRARCSSPARPGSGKSTTLYAGLAAISRDEINIITVEDPVEYRLDGINQVQINLRAGLTFANALRSIIRSDPDVIMVGEIRDGETARISIEAALTGHFVLSTLHTNDAPSAITRLNEMGVEPFLTGAAVSAVLAQRLARKLCVHCAEPYTPTREELLGLRLGEEAAAGLAGATFRRRRGCARCANTGYRGRVGVFQLLPMSERLEQLAAAKAPREEIERAALEEGMRTHVGRRRGQGRGRHHVGRRARPRLPRLTVDRSA